MAGAAACPDPARNWSFNRSWFEWMLSGRALTAWLGYKFSGYDLIASLAVVVLLAICGLAASWRSGASCGRN